MESFIAVIVFFIISSFSFFIGTLMWKNRYNEKLKKILKSSQKELEFYENNIKIIHKLENRMKEVNPEMEFDKQNTDKWVKKISQNYSESKENNR